jgi:hypothetical protein
MPIFNAEDEQTLTVAKAEWKRYNRELFFAYFEHVAVEAIIEQITAQKSEILARFKAGNTEYELLRFSTYSSSSCESNFYRRLLQEDEKTSSPPGCYFTSLTGIHITDLRAIYVHSQFRKRIQEEIGTDMLKVHMYSRKEFETPAITKYENRFVIKYT